MQKNNSIQTLSNFGCNNAPSNYLLCNILANYSISLEKNNYENPEFVKFVSSIAAILLYQTTNHICNNNKMHTICKQSARNLCIITNYCICKKINKFGNLSNFWLLAAILKHQIVYCADFLHTLCKLFLPGTRVQIWGSWRSFCGEQDDIILVSLSVWEEKTVLRIRIRPDAN